MTYKEMLPLIEMLQMYNQEAFIKALISFETDVENDDLIEKLYQSYLETGSMGLLDDRFYCLAAELQAEANE